MQFAECPPREFAEVVAVGRVDPALVGDLPGERAQLRGHARGQVGNAALGTFEFLRQLGAEPVAYGPGLADRVRKLAPGGVTAATDLFGTETAETALALGVPPERISTVAAGPNPPGGVRPTGGVDAGPDAMKRITDAILAGTITVPIAAVFPVEQIRDAVTMQASRHAHGKIVVTL